MLRLNRLVREFFFARDVLEVETPMMSRAGNTDPTENVFPMVQAGKGITEMLLGSEDL